MAKRAGGGWRTVGIAIGAIALGVTISVLLTDRFPQFAKVRDEIVERVRSVFAEQEAIPPPSIPPVSDSFAEQCARLILSDANKDAGACTADDCYATTHDDDAPCGLFCKAFGRVKGSKTFLGAVDCQFNRSARSVPPDVEVTGGTKDKPPRYSSTISIAAPEKNNGGQKICSGVLIGRSLALTAAHCIKEGVAVRGAIVSNETTPSEPNPSAPSVDEAVPMEPDSDGEIDLALVKLKGSFPDDAVARLATAETSASYDYALMRVVGFGFDKQGHFNERRWADVVIATRDCIGEEKISKRPYSGLYGCKAGREIVAGKLTRRTSEAMPAATSRDAALVEALALVDDDTCKGDSGGPAYIVGADIKLKTDNDERNEMFRNQITDERTRAVLGITIKAVDTDDVPATVIKLADDTLLRCGNGGRYVNVAETRTRAWIEKQALEWKMPLAQ